jgi:hypothetical protein
MYAPTPTIRYVAWFSTIFNRSWQASLVVLAFLESAKT